MKKPLFAAILSSAILVTAIPFASSSLHLLVIMMLIGVSSGFFGQSIAWAAEQIERKAKQQVRKSPKASGATIGIRSHVIRGIGINRMIGDIGLILGPLFVGYFVSLLSDDPRVWFVSFGMTSIVLAIVSLGIIRSSGTKVTQDINTRKL
jgi:MFS family permease